MEIFGVTLPDFAAFIVLASGMCVLAIGAVVVVLFLVYCGIWLSLVIFEKILRILGAYTIIVRACQVIRRHSRRSGWWETFHWQ